MALSFPPHEPLDTEAGQAIPLWVKAAEEGGAAGTGSEQRADIKEINEATEPRLLGLSNGLSATGAFYHCD